MRTHSLRGRLAGLLLVACGLILPFVLLGTHAGCGASKPFVQGTTAASPAVVREARHYATTPFRQMDVDALDAAMTTEPRVAASVDRTWRAVRGWYQPAIEADPMLDESERRIRRDTVARFDRLLAAELGRPFGPPATRPVP